MKKILLNYIYWPFFVLMISSLSVKAQDENALPKKRSRFKVGLNYLSNEVYHGRKDSLLVPYLSTSFRYLDLSGFYAKASASYLMSDYAQRIDLVNLSIGYEKSLDDHFAISASIDKSFYNPNSVSVRSEIMGNASIGGFYTSDYLNASADLYAMFSGSRTDLNFDFALSHDFSFADEAWSIEPSVSTSISTRNYYDKYISVRQTKNGKKKTGSGSNTIGPTTITTTVNAMNPEQFVVMAYELSLPIYYYGKKWGCYLTPSFAIPQSAITYVTNTTTTTITNGVAHSKTVGTLSEERFGNVFYAEAGIFFKF
ncbi:MAG: hypothetical protein K2Q21_05305 [Chitinophagaceae bacterium]|nr:hypothetical protein [Chitinophagaceae bacterium]